MIIIINQHH